MIHIRIVAPEESAHRALDMLCEADAVASVVHLHGAAHKPKGDVIFADIAREDASVILDALKELKIDEEGSISLEEIDTSVSKAARDAEKAAHGLPSDAVVWEEVEARTEENVELGGSFLAFMAIAVLIAAIGVMTDAPILIIGAMVVGPEFGPLAALCVAIVERRGDLAKRSLTALAVGFPFAMALTLGAVAILRTTGPAPDTIAVATRPLTQFISEPNVFSVVVAAVAGVAGILSLTSAKSGALIGVLISVTTIPAAGNASAAIVYGEWSEVRGALEQLFINLVTIVLAGVVAMFIQRRLYLRRRKQHQSADYRRAAGLPAQGAGSSR